MKVRQAIELARGLKQIDQVNYPDLLMLQFLNECEGKLQTEFLHIADVDCQRYTENDMEMDLIVGPPHDKLYYAYLCAMVDFTNGEYAKYNNSIIVANAFMAEWAAWFNRTHERDGRQYLGVFLSAYGIAVKHGYAGTEEEWLESLRGPEGQQGIQGKPGPQGAPGTVSFDKLTEEQLAMLIGPEGKQGVPGTDGQDGVGIQSVEQTTTSTEDGGTNVVTVTKTDGTTSTFYVRNGSRGSTGPAGSDGQDGVGIQSVEQTTTSTEDGGTNVVTVTKTDGTTSTFYVRNGSRGSTGPAGSDGQDGVSPLVSVSEITGGHRVSIQDADGTSSFDVMDGQDGKDGQSGAAGADGITPTIGANGNWYVGQTDTGVPATGQDGKTAYQYAVEGGYTGTEEAFSAKLAAEIPTVLPNPNALTFTGAVTGSYDGSAPLEVEIPSGGGGITVTNTAAVGQTVKITAVDENGQPTEWEAVDMVSGGADAGNLLYDVVLDADSTIEITDFDTDLGEYLVIIGTVVPEKGIVSNVKLFNTMGSDYYLKINAGFAVLSIYYRIIGNVFWMVRDVNYRVNTDFANITEPPGTPSSHSNANIRSGAYKFGEKTSGLKSSTIWPTGTHVWIYGR